MKGALRAIGAALQIARLSQVKPASVLDDLYVGPLEQAVIRRALEREPFLAKRIADVVLGTETDTLSLPMPRLLPEGFFEEEWYVELNHTTGIHRLVVSFAALGRDFSYNQAFIGIPMPPESVLATMCAEIGRAAQPLSRWVDMTQMGHDPTAIGTSIEDGFLKILIAHGEDLVPWRQFEAEILETHRLACERARQDS